MSDAVSDERPTLLRFWLRYAHRYRWVYAAGLLCLLATNALTVAVPAFVERAIDALERGQNHSDATVWALAIVLVGLSVMVVRTLSRTLFFNPGRTIEFRVKNDLFEHLLDLPQAVRDQLRPGELISRGTNDTSAVRALVGFGSLALVNTSLMLVLTIIQMLVTNTSLTLVCLIPLLVSAGVLMLGVRLMWKQYARLQQQLANLSDRILETYNSVSVLHAFGAHAGARARFSLENDALVAIGLTVTRIRSWLLPVVSVTGSACVALVLWAGGGMVQEGSLSVGQLAAFIGYVTIVVTGLTTLGWGFNSIQRGYVALTRIFDVLDTPAGRPEPTTEVPEAVDGGLSLEVRDLRFVYPDAETPALQGVSFRLAPGETLGVFGLTGSGKTTLLNLLARVYDPPPKAVMVGDVDVLETDVSEYWRRVTYVPQEAFLFSRSIRANIGLSAEYGASDPSRVNTAATDAALDDDIAVLPDGLDTEVGERGITLSGGQRQRSALARAFYRDFDLLLLDDVMSAVDHATEEHLIDAVYRRGAGSTTVIVSHRISVLERAAKIIVLEAGRCLDVGTHEALLSRCEVYQRAWRLQQAEREDEAASVSASRGSDG